jgi:hypothetical protein
MLRPDMLVQSPLQSKASVGASEKPSEATAVGPFDGHWEGTNAHWGISGTVADNVFDGNVDYCTRRDNALCNYVQTAFRLHKIAHIRMWWDGRTGVVGQQRWLARLRGSDL